MKYWRMAMEQSDSLKKALWKENPLADVTGVLLTPGNGGADCLGNGMHRDGDGNIIECCCEECNYFLCCTAYRTQADCMQCSDGACPHSGGQKNTYSCRTARQ